MGLLLGSGVLVLAGGDLTASIRSPWWVAVAVLQCGAVALRRVSPATALVVCWCGAVVQVVAVQLSLIHISEPTRLNGESRLPACG